MDAGRYSGTLTVSSLGTSAFHTSSTSLWPTSALVSTPSAPSSSTTASPVSDVVSQEGPASSTDALSSQNLASLAKSLPKYLLAGGILFLILVLFGLIGWAWRRRRRRRRFEWSEEDHMFFPPSSRSNSPESWKSSISGWSVKSGSDEWHKVRFAGEDMHWEEKGRKERWSEEGRGSGERLLAGAGARFMDQVPRPPPTYSPRRSRSLLLQ